MEIIRLISYLLTFIFLTMLFLIYFDRGSKTKYTVPMSSSKSDRQITGPAYGTIIDISNTEDDEIRIAIFLSVFNIHKQYYPYHGKVKSHTCEVGEHHLAFDESKSKYNQYIF